MLDTRLRRAAGPTLDRAGARLVVAGVPALALTGAGFACGVLACVAVLFTAWPVALLFWLLNRLLDGLDGPVARGRGEAGELGGFLDIVSDFTIYAGFVVATALAVPEARTACVVLLFAYYVSGTSFLALSSLLERRGQGGGDPRAAAEDDGRSLRFVGGLAEGSETIAAYVLFCLLPAQIPLLAWVFAAMVAITAVQRVALGVALLRRRAPSPPAHAVPDHHLEP